MTILPVPKCSSPELDTFFAMPKIEPIETKHSIFDEPSNGSKYTIYFPCCSVSTSITVSFSSDTSKHVWNDDFNMFINSSLAMTSSFCCVSPWTFVIPDIPYLNWNACDVVMFPRGEHCDVSQGGGALWCFPGGTPSSHYFHWGTAFPPWQNSNMGDRHSLWQDRVVNNTAQAEDAMCMYVCIYYMCQIKWPRPCNFH